MNKCGIKSVLMPLWFESFTYVSDLLSNEVNSFQDPLWRTLFIWVSLTVEWLAFSVAILFQDFGDWSGIVHVDAFHLNS